MIHVRRHIRITSSGKRTSVRAHEREGDDGLQPVPEWSRPPYVGDLAAPAGDDTETTVTEDWWDDDAPQDDDEVFLLTARSRSGRRVNIITGADSDTVAVYGRADLDRRLAAAEADPDIEATYRPADA